MTIINPGGFCPTKAYALFDNPVDLDNFLYDTDSYKYSHATQYPEGTEAVFSYVEPRAPWGDTDEVLFFGLQMELARLRGRVLTQAMLDEATPFLKMHGFDIYAEGFQYIIDEHDGRLPVRIDALPEGTIAPVQVPQLRIVNTDPKCWWLPSFVETRLLRAVWYPCTVATLSHFIARSIRKRMLITDGTMAGAEFKLHDFGARGSAAKEAAGIGGTAHLVNSFGTDTVIALAYARNYYGADMAAFSVPASEHSTATALGPDGERDQMERMLDQYPSGLMSFVSDSYDLMRAVTQYWGKDLKKKVLERDGTLVVRPDSGDPVEIVPDVIEALMAAYGFDYTPTGYKLLNEKVRVLQGDGINQHSIVEIMEEMMRRGLAIGNVVFGMGGALLQQPNRDDFSYSMKASANYRDGKWVDIFKDPVTSKGTKTSKKGRIGVMKTDSGAFCTRPMENIPAGHDAMETVFLNGEITKLQTLEEIRDLVWTEAGWK